MNGDGKPDLVVANCSSSSSDCSGGGGTVGVLLGNGDGTFQTAVTFGSGGNTPFWVAVEDLNGDGKPDIVAANCASNVCGAAPGTLGVLINTSLTPTATALTSSPNPSKFGQTVTFTATVTAQAGFDKGTPTGTVSFFDGTTKMGTSNVDSSGVATLTSTTLAVGTDSITATYSGDTNFVTSTSPAVQQVVQSAQGATSHRFDPVIRHGGGWQQRYSHRQSEFGNRHSARRRNRDIRGRDQNPTHCAGYG